MTPANPLAVYAPSYQISAIDPSGRTEHRDAELWGDDDVIYGRFGGESAYGGMAY